MDHVPESDQQIIEEVRSGNTRRYAILVDRHKERAMTLAVRLVGNREEAEEIVQDAFLRAFRGLDQFRGDARFTTWFYRIVYNLCMTKMSRRGPRHETVDLLDEKQRDRGEEAVSVLERMEQEEFQAMLAEEVQRLPEKLKTAVTLFYVQEMSYEEMAETLDLPLGTVKTNLFRGRNLLRQRMLEKLRDEVSVS